MSLPDRAQMVELLARMDEARWNDPSAKACIVTIDLDSDEREVLNVVGPYDTPHEAIIAAGLMDTEDARQFAMDESHGKWQHVVVPIWAPD